MVLFDSLSILTPKKTSKRVKKKVEETKKAVKPPVKKEAKKEVVKKNYNATELIMLFLTKKVMQKLNK